MSAPRFYSAQSAETVVRRCPLCGQHPVEYRRSMTGEVVVAWHLPPPDSTVTRIGSKGHCWYSGTVLPAPKRKAGAR